MTPGSVAIQPLLADSNQLRADVERVTAWRAAQPGWRMEFWNTAGHLDSPVGMVDKSVVAAAERHAVIDAGGAMVGPMDYMMNIVPAARD
jgi:hypothetical protein